MFMRGGGIDIAKPDEQRVPKLSLVMDRVEYRERMGQDDEIVDTDFGADELLKHD